MTAYSPNHRSLIRLDSTTKLQFLLTALLDLEQGLGCAQDMNLQKLKPLLQSIIRSLSLPGSCVRIRVLVGIQDSCHLKDCQSKSCQRNIHRSKVFHRINRVVCCNLMDASLLVPLQFYFLSIKLIFLFLKTSLH